MSEEHEQDVTEIIKTFEIAVRKDERKDTAKAIFDRLRERIKRMAIEATKNKLELRITDIIIMIDEEEKEMV